MKIFDKNINLLITGKKTGSNELLMIPVYNPNIGSYLAEKIIQEQYYGKLKIVTNENKIIFEK